MNTVLLGHGSLGLAVAHGLLATPGVSIVGIYAWCDHPGSGFPDFHAKLDAPLKRLAKQHGIPLLALGQTHEAAFLQWLDDHAVQWVQMGCWGEILKPALINRPGLHILNCHPSPLPRHKGPNPYASVIRQNETHTAITFHRVDAGVDTGPIILQHPVRIDAHDSGGSLQARIDAQATQLVPDVYHALCQALPGQAQPADGSYYPNIQQDQALIQWKADPAAVERNARALTPWVQPYAFWNGQVLVIMKRLKLVKRDATLPTADPLPAGTLITINRQAILVASQDPARYYRLEQYHIAVGDRKLPRLLSQAVGTWLLRPEWGSFWHYNMLETAY